MNRDHGRVPGAEQLMATVVDHTGSAPVLTVTGEVDMMTAPRLVAALRDALHVDGLRALIVDLRGVTFFSSAGIAAVVEGRELALAMTVRLRLVVDGNRSVTRPLEVSGAAALLDLHVELEDAVRAEACRGDG